MVSGYHTNIYHVEIVLSDLVKRNIEYTAYKHGLRSAAVAERFLFSYISHFGATRQLIW